MKHKRLHVLWEPFLPVLVEMAANMVMTKENVFLCQILPGAPANSVEPEV